MAWPEGCSLLLPHQTRKEVVNNLIDCKKRFLKIQNINDRAKEFWFKDLTWKDFLWTQCCITSRNLECDNGVFSAKTGKDF